MPWTSPSTRSTGYTVTASNWNELVNDLLFLKEVNYTAFTADVSITATAVGSANQIVSSGAITYENVPHLIEFYCPYYANAAQECRVILRDSTTVIGTMARIVTSQNQPIYIAQRITPSAASHTYNVAAWLGGAGTGTMNAGTGGTAGDSTTDMSGFIRITRIPT